MLEGRSLEVRGAALGGGARVSEALPQRRYVRALPAVAVLDGGRIVAEGTADELKAQISGSHVRLRFTGSAEYERAIGAFPGAARDDDALALRVAGDGGLDALRILLDRLDAAGVGAADFSAHTPDLDDVFLALTGRDAGEAPLDAKEAQR